MIRIAARCCMVLGLIQCLSSLCAAADGAKKEFQSFLTLEAPKLTAAFDHKDTSFFDKLYAPNFHVEDEHGVANGKKVAMFLLRFRFNTLQKVNYHAKILSLTAANGVGIVTLMTVLDGVTQVRGGGKGTPVKVTRLEKEVFVKDRGAWRLSLEKDLKKPAVVMKGAQPFAPMRMVPAKPKP